MPAGAEGIIAPVPVPTYTVGAGPGGFPVAKLYDTVGNLVREVMAFDPSFRGGVRVATADINGDLIKDIIAVPGPGMTPEIRVFSGANGTLIRQFFAYAPAFTGGVFVAAGDVNGDGRADIITGAGAGGGPHVQAFSGVNNALLTSIIAYDPSFRGGVSVGAGNVAGGFLAQIITGAGVGGGPHVRVFNGLNGSPISSFFAFDPSTRFGVNVAALPGATFGVTAIVTAFGAGGPPQVRVFNNPQTIVADFFAYDVNFLGGVNVGAAPAGGFGANAILTGAGTGGGPHVKVLQLGVGPPVLVQNFFAFDATFLGGVYVG